MRIYLTGFMGAGKSKLGKRLAHRLGIPFLDLDKVIEESESMSITEIFENKGEEAFRMLEQKHLHETKSLENAVIATGGGTPCFFDNMDWIRRQGVSIYLYLPPGLLFGRVRQGKAKRPLLLGMSDAELRDFIRSKLRARLPYYRRADIVIYNNDVDIELLLMEISQFVDGGRE